MRFEPLHPYTYVGDILKALDAIDKERAEAYKRGQRDRAANFPSAEDKEHYQAAGAYIDGYSAEPEELCADCRTQAVGNVVNAPVGPLCDDCAWERYGANADDYL